MAQSMVVVNITSDGRLAAHIPFGIVSSATAETIEKLIKILGRTRPETAPAHQALLEMLTENQRPESQNEPHLSDQSTIDRVHKELRLRNYSHKTIKAYVSSLRSFLKHFFPRKPEELTDADLRAYLLHMIEEEHHCAATVNQAINALRFLYVEVYKRPLVMEDIPRPAKERHLPDVLSVEEVLKILDAVKNMKHKTILMLIYSAGLRVGESVRVKLADVDEQRQMIFLRGAKGNSPREITYRRVHASVSLRLRSSIATRSEFLYWFHFSAHGTNQGTQ